MSDDIYIEANVPVFEAIYGKGLISLGGVNAIKKMFSNYRLRSKHLLDVGSGIGGMAYYLAEQYDCQVTGLEIYEWMAQYATKHAPQNIKAQLQFITYQVDHNIPINHESFDLCCSKGVLTNVENKLKLFQELYRVLKPKGDIVFIDWIVPESNGPKRERLRMGDQSFKETQSTYTKLLQKAAFKNIQFSNKSAEYLEYVIQLDKLYHSEKHRKTYGNIINDALRNELIQSNNDLKESIESGQQLSMLITATKL